MSKEEKLNEKYPFQFYTFSNISMLERDGFNFDDYSFNLKNENELYIGNINGLICRHDMGYPLRMLKYLTQEPDTLVKRKLTFLLPENYKENINDLKGLRENIIKVFELPCFNGQINIMTYKVDNSNIMEKIEELKIMPKFDVIIANPPYGEKSVGDRQLHYKITEKLLSCYNKNMIVIMPDKIITCVDSRFDKYKKVFNTLSKIESCGNPFKGFACVNTAFFTFENHIVDKVNVNGKYYNTLFDILPFTDYENTFMEKLSSDYAKNHWHFMGYDTTKYINILNDFSFSVNRENGAKNGKFFSSLLINEPIKSKNDMNTFLLNYKATRKACFSSNNKTEMVNLKDAMLRPLCQFGLYKMQEDQNMALKVFKYIPDIDWTDNKTLTDEGILEMVGCTPDEAKEFAEYVKNFMANIDK